MVAPITSRPTVDVDYKYITTTLTVAANTTPAAQSVDLGRRTLVQLDVLFANGANGLVGINIAYSGVVLLPWNQPGVFLVGNNERRTFDMGIDLGGPLSVSLQNVDASFPHKLVLTLKMAEYDLLTAPPDIPLIPLEALNA